MNENLAGLSVLVTGAASGIGRQLARDLSREGCRLTLLDKDLAGLETLKKELNSPSLTIHRCDIGSSVEIEKFLADISERTIDVLVNNAGIVHVGAFETMAISDFEKVLEVNLLGTVRLTRGVLPKLLASRRGAIVNVSSLAGLIGAPGMAAYSASKFALMGFTESLAGELHGRVKVCAVCPSFVRTRIVEGGLLRGDLARPEKIGRMNGVLTRFGADAQKVSQAIIGAIASDKTLVLVNADARFLHWLNRFSPFLARTLVRWGYRYLVRNEIVA